MKARTAPMIQAYLEAAVRRIVPHHSKEPLLQGRLSAVRAGFAGEQVLDRVLAQYQFSFPHAVFHDLSLHSSAPFQMDTLFVTPSCAVVIEVKNIAGTLEFRSNPPQLHRTLDNGQTASFECPASQTERKVELLMDWFAARDIPLPVSGLVVFAHPRHPVNASVDLPLLHPSGVPDFLRKLPASPTALAPSQFSSLTDALLTAHRAFHPSPICEAYDLAANDFLPGVLCAHCPQTVLKKTRSGWICMVCGTPDSAADTRAVQDWFLLFGGLMSNRCCRDFLQLTSRHSAYRVLQRLPLLPSGGPKNRQYAADLSSLLAVPCPVEPLA